MRHLDFKARRALLVLLHPAATWAYGLVAEAAQKNSRHFRLGNLLLNQKCADKDYRAVLDEVKKTKRETARTVMAQGYRPPVEP